MATVSPIAVKNFVNEHNRSLEKDRKISSWFLTETLVVDFGDYVGRPSSLITLQKEYITRFLENGWTIDAVMHTSETGRWTTYSTSKTKGVETEYETNNSSSGTSSSSSGRTQESSSTTTTSKGSGSSTNTSNESSSSSSSDTSNSSSNSSNQSTTITTNNSSSHSTGSSSSASSSSSSSGSNSGRSSSASSSYNTSGSSTSGTTTTTTNGSSSSDSKNESSSSDNSSGKSTTSAKSSSSSSDSSKGTTTTTRSDSTSGSQKSSGIKSISGTDDETGVTETTGDAYWAAIQRVRLARRRMQPELVLQDMISSYVRQFNDGIANEDSRFNELVTLYGIMLNRTETEVNAIVSNALDVTGLFDRMYGAINLSVTAANNRAMRFGRYSVDGAVAEIKIKYENLIAKTRSEMVGNGTYNGTVWPTVEAGIKRQMEVAMAEATREGYKDAIDADVKVLSAKGDVMAQLVNAKNNIAAAIDQRKVTATEMRNTVLNAMINFIGSRQDAFPQIQEISQLASQIGFTVGAAGNVL